MIDYSTAIGLVASAIIIGAGIGYIIGRYHLKYAVKFSFKMPEDEQWHRICVVRLSNEHTIYADGEVLISEKEGDHIWRSDI